MMFSSLTEATSATEPAQFRCFKVQREAENMQAQIPAEFRRIERNKRKDKTKKRPCCYQFPLNLVQVSPVADYSAR